MSNQNTLYNNASGNTAPPSLAGEAQSQDQLVNQAIDAVAKGENVEQVLEVMLTTLPADAREKVKKKFIAALAKKGLRQPSGEADIPSRATLTRIREALAVSTRQMVDRVMQLARTRPDIANRIQQAGQALASSGVSADKVPVSEGDLGTMTPLAAGKPQQDRGTGTSRS